MAEDIRDKPFITHDDVIGLNFINSAGPFVFRRHFRQGLRSHVMEILRPADLALERTGTLINGTRWFPKARPFKIFRLFRTRLNSLEKALKEIERVMLVERYLAPDYLARSDEFVVDYLGPQGPDLMLCGFQEYVEGEILDPWSLLDGETFTSDLYERLGKTTKGSPVPQAQWIQGVKQKTARFIERIKTMITETGHLPDLAGRGNMIMIDSGHIKLVDINNISAVAFDATIALDDHAYPVCDKSIEALARIEHMVLGHVADTKEPIYQTFLDPVRMAEAKTLEAHFYRRQSRQQRTLRHAAANPASG
jgi:hypothetical protein